MRIQYAEYVYQVAAGFARMRLLVLGLFALLLPSALALGVGEGVSVSVEDRSVWLYEALVAPVEVAAVGISPAKDLDSVTVGVLSWGSTTEAAAGASHRVEHFFDPRAPGAYIAVAEARASSGDAARDTGRVDIQLIPFQPESVQGFPPLGDVEEPLTGVSYSIELVVQPDGSVGYYRVSIGGQVLLDNAAVAPFPEPHDRFVSIFFNRGSGEGIMSIDGEVAWRGLVRQTGGEWWHVVPVAVIGAIGPSQAAPQL